MKLWHLIVGIAVLLILILTLMLNGLNFEYSSGNRVGTITKFSKKGYVFKTWEGELMMGGLRPSGDGQSVVPNVFLFSVTDPAVCEQIDQAMTKGNRVKVHYQQVWVAGMAKGETSYFIKKVEEVSEAPKEAKP